MKGTVDGHGRVVIPKVLRERLGLEPSTRVTVREEADRVVVEKVLSQGEALRRLGGSIHKDNRLPDAPVIDPLDLKKIWEPRV